MEIVLTVICFTMFAYMIFWNVAELVGDIRSITSADIIELENMSNIEVVCTAILHVFITIGRVILRFIYSVLVLITIFSIANGDLETIIGYIFVAIILGIGLQKVSIMHYIPFSLRKKEHED